MLSEQNLDLKSSKENGYNTKYKLGIALFGGAYMVVRMVWCYLSIVLIGDEWFADV